ncbi:hypothetical protein [Corallococcus interemptor]|uniref:hypothetical protein n=1 Tax=Corallococcus interemptor TaxID=2316720 RepID=UPI0011C3442C|nr:hypothetical protein [Corallococcus interemptor]
MSKHNQAHALESPLTIPSGNERLIAALCEHSVRFLIIGGIAVRHYAASRVARDLDLLIEPEPSNAKKTLQALARLSLFLTATPDRLTLSAQQSHIYTAEFCADIVTPRPEVDFEKEWQAASLARIRHHRVRVISRAGLIRMKTATGRSKDEADIELLISQEP